MEQQVEIIRIQTLNARMRLSMCPSGASACVSECCVCGSVRKLRCWQGLGLQAPDKAGTESLRSSTKFLTSRPRAVCSIPDALIGEKYDVRSLYVYTCACIYIHVYIYIYINKCM